LPRGTENALEALAHLSLRLNHGRIKRREIRHVGGAREQTDEPRGCGLRIKRARQAKPQHLRQIVIEPHRRTEHFGIFRAQEPKPPRLVEDTRR